MDDQHMFRDNVWIYADAAIPGGIVAIWGALGANLSSVATCQDDLNLLRMAVLQLVPTGRGRWNLALVKNIDPEDGRIAMLEYSLSYSWRGFRQIASFLVRKIDFPEDQVRANDLHNIQIDLHSALIDCDMSNCRLSDEFRAGVAALASNLVRRALRNEISVGLVRRRASQLLKLVVPAKPATA
jgi:MoaA/NifB/PqqE/SkfB family radical SAM enzyme